MLTMSSESLNIKVKNILPALSGQLPFGVWSDQSLKRDNTAAANQTANETAKRQKANEATTNHTEKAVDNHIASQLIP